MTFQSPFRAALLRDASAPDHRKTLLMSSRRCPQKLGSKVGSKYTRMGHTHPI